MSLTVLLFPSSVCFLLALFKEFVHFLSVFFYFFSDFFKGLMLLFLKDPYNNYYFRYFSYGSPVLKYSWISLVGELGFSSTLSALAAID